MPSQRAVLDSIQIMLKKIECALLKLQKIEFGLLYKHIIVFKKSL